MERTGYTQVFFECVRSIQDALCYYASNASRSHSAPPHLLVRRHLQEPRHLPTALLTRLPLPSRHPSRSTELLLPPLLPPPPLRLSPGTRPPCPPPQLPHHRRALQQQQQLLRPREWHSWPTGSRFLQPQVVPRLSLQLQRLRCGWRSRGKRRRGESRCPL